MKKLYLLLVALIISGCHHNENSSDTQLQTGHFVDSFVNGIKYSTPTVSGITQNGMFQYKEGEEVRFYIGDLQIGSSQGRDLITTNDFTYPIAAGRILQTFDYNGNADDGIDIPVGIRNTNSFYGVNSQTFMSDIDNTEHKNLLESLTTHTQSGKKEIVSKDVAKKHMSKYHKYSLIDKALTNGGINGSYWEKNYGYNEKYSLDYLTEFTNSPTRNPGIDLKVSNGTNIYSISNGIVTKVDRAKGMVFIRPNSEKGTLVYKHLTDIQVSKNVHINAAQLLGKSSNLNTNQYKVNLTWLKTEDNDINHSSGQEPKDITKDMQNFDSTISDLTYDLKDFTLYRGQNFVNYNGEWTMRLDNIPDSSGTVVNSVIEITGNTGTYKYKATRDINYFINGKEIDCSLVSSDEGKVTVNYTNDKFVEIVFDESIDSPKDTCSNGTWIQGPTYAKGAKLKLKINTSNTDATLQTQICNWSLISKFTSRCVIENQSYLQTGVKDYIENKDPSFHITDVIEIARAKNWDLLVKFFEHWFNGSGNTYIIELDDAIAISSTLQTKIDEWKASKLYNKVFYTYLVSSLKIYDASILENGGKFDLIKEELKKAGNTFHNSDWDKDNLYYVQDKSIEADKGINEEFATFANYNLRIVPAGEVVKKANGDTVIIVDKLGIYLRDSFDFIDDKWHNKIVSQMLGCWSKKNLNVYAPYQSFSCKILSNVDFRKYNTSIGRDETAGDFSIFTDPEKHTFSVNFEFCYKGNCQNNFD